MSHSIQLQPTDASGTPVAPVPPLRLQVAVVRALLDELEGGTPADVASTAVERRLADELERLGREALRMSTAISRGGTPPQRAPTPDAGDDLDPIPHWLPLVAF